MKPGSSHSYLKYIYIYICDEINVIKTYLFDGTQAFFFLHIE